MGDKYPKFRAAAVQAAPVFLNREATIEKACDLIKEASDNGAELIAFPEVYIPAYPYWPKEHYGRRPGYKVFVELFKNSVEIPSKESDLLCQAARKARAYVAMGLNERDGGTLYNTILFLSKEGKVMGKHRKLMPTYTERAVWGMGDGSDLKVFDTELGKLGGLICGEHLMTLSRYALFTKGEQVHVSVWPGSAGVITTIDTMNKSYALEGQAFVIVASGYITADMVPDDFELKEHTPWEVRGGSGIISPRGTYLAGPLYDQEGIVYADIDLEMIVWAKAMVDVVGHYARPDVTRLILDERKLAPIETVDTSAGADLREAVDRLTQKVSQIGDEELKQAIEGSADSERS